MCEVGPYNVADTVELGIIVALSGDCCTVHCLEARTTRVTTYYPLWESDTVVDLFLRKAACPDGYSAVLRDIDISDVVAVVELMGNRALTAQSKNLLESKSVNL